MSQVVEVAQPQRRARGLSAEVLARTLAAPWRWLRTRVERLRAPIDFEPL
jgi:hypothetical protein